MKAFLAFLSSVILDKMLDKAIYTPFEQAFASMELEERIIRIVVIFVGIIVISCISWGYDNKKGIDNVKNV